MAMQPSMADFHEERKTGIGGSDAAAVLGLARWGTPMTVWASKVGLTEPSEPTLRQWVGTQLEPLLAQMFSERTGIKVRRRWGMVRSKQWPWMIGHLDFVGLETKTSISAEGWGEDGSVLTTEEQLDVIPLDYLIQVQHYLAVTEWPKMHVAVLIRHDDFRTYEVHRFESFIERLAQAEGEFWNTYVVTGTPPPLDDSDATRAWLRQKYPHAMGAIRPATPEETLILSEYVDTQAQEKAVKSTLETLKAQLAAAIGDDLGIKAPGLTAVRSEVTKKGEVNWQAIAGAYRTIIEETRSLYTEAALADLPSTVQLALENLDGIQSVHTGEPTSYRRLDIRR